MIDLTGKRFGSLVVESVATERKRGVKSWVCNCDCGNIKIIAGPDLRVGDTTSCGCTKYKSRPKDIAGKRFGKLLAVDRTPEKSKNGDYLWNCICDCGNTFKTTIGRLNFGQVISCGCAVYEASQLRRKYTKEISESKTYSAWAHIKDRCYNPNNQDYHTYGARGVKMHESFLEDFMMFYNEIGEPPDNKHRWSVDRISSKGDYAPGNIRWATDDQQARNKGKMRNNTTGVTGVIWYYSGKPGHTTYAAATWSPGVKQKSKNKKFSCKKLGVMVAFRNAVIYREKMIQELNARGAGYTENHGK